MVEDKEEMGVPASPSGSQASPGAAFASPPSVSIPNAICGYPLPGWRLDLVQWDERQGQPDGWIVSLKREKPDLRFYRREFVVMARSDVGPLEAWAEALQIALRSDARDAAERAASGIEAPSGGEPPRGGSTEGESPTGEAGDAQDPAPSQRQGS